MMERCACYRRGERWGNGSKFKPCLGSEEGMEDQMKGAIKGRVGLRKELKKSQRGRLKKEKEDKVVDLRWALSWIRGTGQETSYLPCHRCWAGLEGNLASRPFDLGPMFWALKAAGGFYSSYHLHCYHGFSTAINVMRKAACATAQLLQKVKKEKESLIPIFMEENECFGRSSFTFFVSITLWSLVEAGCRTSWSDGGCQCFIFYFKVFSFDGSKKSMLYHGVVSNPASLTFKRDIWDRFSPSRAD